MPISCKTISLNEPQLDRATEDGRRAAVSLMEHCEQISAHYPQAVIDEALMNVLVHRGRSRGDLLSTIGHLANGVLASVTMTAAQGTRH